MSTHDSPAPASGSPGGRSTGGRTIAVVLVVGALVVLVMWILARRTPPGPASGGAPPPAAGETGTQAPLPDAGVTPQNVVRRPIEGDIELLAPVGEVPGAGLVFRWTSRVTEPIRAWEVRIFTGSMNPVWNSDDLDPAVAELAAPAELVALLQPGQRYQWRLMGKAEKAKGQRVRSALQDFSVTGP